MAGIWWEGFSWEAFTTLLTGCAAVGGAVWVGREQLRIQRTQLRIQEKQTEIQDLQLRASLFEPRLMVVKAVTAFVRPFISRGWATESETKEFTDALSHAYYLFSPNVTERLDHLGDLYVRYKELQPQRIYDPSLSRVVEAPDPPENIEARRLIIDEVNNLRVNLEMLFAEMKIDPEA